MTGIKNPNVIENKLAIFLINFVFLKTKTNPNAPNNIPWGNFVMNESPKKNPDMINNK